MKTRAKERGFTRGDLAAVLARVGMLALLTGPVWGTSQPQGDGAECLANSKRLGAAVLQHALDNEERFPPNPDDANSHVEMHRWVDSRTPVVGGSVSRRTVPGSEDYAWLQERTSVPK